MRVAWLMCVAPWLVPSPVEEPALVQGVVSDARTKEPLPLYLLELQAGSKFDRVTSDEHGKFSSSIVFPVGELVVRFVDDDAVQRNVMQGGLQVASAGEVSRTLRFEGKPLDVSAPAGPTFRMSWKSPQAEGSPTTAGTSTAELVWEGTDSETTLRAGVRVEPDGRGWARFAPIPDGIAGGGPKLRVLSVDRLWMSEAPVAGKGVEALDLSWRPCARWTGVLKDRNSRAVPGTWVRLERLDEKNAVSERRRTRCDPAGKYAFEALDAGRWRLRGDPLRFQPFESEVRDVVVGEVSQLSIVLEGARETAPINGRIEGAPAVEGQPVPGEPAIVVRRAGDPLPQETLRAGWKTEGGRYVALFIVPRLPVGDYDFELVPAASDADGWTALTARAKAGGNVVFTHR